MKSKTRYRCEYCGTDVVLDTLPLYALKSLRCKVCNHGKFKTKLMDDKSGNQYGYDKPTTFMDWDSE